MADDGDQVSSCSACREEYDDNEDHIPRLLPCFHTICQGCLQLLLDDKSLSCPVCRKVHPATEGVNSFQKNIYIISNIKKKNTFAKCKLHDGKELSLFCKTADCQRNICQLCLLKEHIGHEVVDIAEEQKQKKEQINNIADELTSELTVARENLLEARKSMEECNTASLVMLKKKKADTINLMDKVINDVTKQINVSNEEVYKEVDSIDADLKLVCSTKERAAKSKISEGFAAADIELERFQQIKDRVKKYLLQEKIFQYYENDAAKPEKIVVSLSDTRNANSSQIKDEVRLAGIGNTSSRSNDISDEVLPIGAGNTSSRSNDISDEVLPIGAGNTSSRSNDISDEVLPIGRGSTSSRSNEKRGEVRPIGRGSTSPRSSDISDEVLPIGRGSTSSRSNEKRDEVLPIGRGSTSSRSNDIGDEVLPIGRGSTSSRSNEKRDEVLPIGRGSTSPRSNDISDEVRPIGKGSTNSNANNKRNEAKPTETKSFSSSSNVKRDEARLTETLSFSSSSKDNRDEVKPIAFGMIGSNSNNEVTLSDSESSRTGISSYFAQFAAAFGNDIILAGTDSSGLDSNVTHRDAAVGFQETGLLGSKDDDTYDDCVVVPRTSNASDDNLFVEPPAKKICAQEGGIHKMVKSFQIGRNVASCRVLPDGSVLVSSRRKDNHSYMYDLIKFGPGNEVGEECTTLQQKCHGMTEMFLAGRPCLALTCNEKIEFRDLMNLKEVISSYSVSEQDFRCVCFSAPLNVLFYENRSKSRSTILQLDCSKSPPVLKSIVKQITTFTIVNEMCYLQHGDEDLLVTAQKDAVCIYNTQTAELKWSQKTFLHNEIPAVTVDEVGYVLICNTRLERINKISVTGEELGIVLRNREKLFQLRKMQWCNRYLTLVYKNFKDQWCVTVFSMGTHA